MLSIIAPQKVHKAEEPSNLSKGIYTQSRKPADVCINEATVWPNQTFDN